MGEQRNSRISNFQLRHGIFDIPLFVCLYNTGNAIVFGKEHGVNVGANAGAIG